MSVVYVPNEIRFFIYGSLCFACCVYCHTIREFSSKELGFLRDLKFSINQLSQSFQETLHKCILHGIAENQCGSLSYHEGLRECRTYKTPFRDSTYGQISPGWKTYVLNEGACPVHLDYYHNRQLKLCYKYKHIKGFMLEAIAGCEAEGGRVIILDSDEKQHFLEMHLNTGSLFDHVNIGGVRDFGGYTWYTPDRQVMMYLNFNPYVSYGDGGSIYIRMLPGTWVWKAHNGVQTYRAALCEVVI